jgi:DNA replication protein DnaC
MARAASELAHLFRALKAPAAARALPVLADRAREEARSYERFAEALLSTEVASRDSHGGEGRIKAARLPARKTLEEFDFTFQRSVNLAIAISIRACLAGQRVQFATATQWVARLSEAKRQGSLETELRRLSFIPLIVVDEVGYIPFDPEAANLMFSLVSSRYERASMIVTSNKPFSAWGEIFGDDMAATAMIDRLIHHSEILSLKGDSYRLRGKDLDARLAKTAELNRPRGGVARRAQAATSSARRYAPSLRSQPLDPPRVVHFSTGAGGPLFNRP